jgi:hypothetical protein
LLCSEFEAFGCRCVAWDRVLRHHWDIDSIRVGVAGRVKRHLRAGKVIPKRAVSGGHKRYARLLGHRRPVQRPAAPVRTISEDHEPSATKLVGGVLRAVDDGGCRHCRQQQARDRCRKPHEPTCRGHDAERDRGKRDRSSAMWRQRPGLGQVGGVGPMGHDARLPVDRLLVVVDGVSVRPRTWPVNRGSRTFVAAAPQIAPLSVVG